MELMFDILMRRASETPDAEALVCKDTRLTYREFDAVSSRIAAYLRSSGVKRGDRVCISMPKSAEYVCTIFGVMKSGAAYVPIDHEYPTTRMFQIISETEAQVMVVSSEAFARLGEDDAFPASLRHALVLDSGTESALPDQNGGVQVTAWQALKGLEGDYQRPAEVIDHDLAYILYTSGSTGRPKGVMLTHGNLITFLNWCRDKFRLRADDRVLQTSPFTFDISGLDMFCALDAGATCVVVEDQRVVNMVLATMQKERITFVSTVPTVIGAMVQRPRVFQRYDLSSIHTFITGSAVIPPVFLIKLAEHLPNAKLYNLYGPTEATIYCLYHPIDASTLDPEASVPIGKPFENTDCFVVRPDGTEADPGEEGELVLRGSHVARGYFKNSEKTEEVFRDHPLLPHLNEKVYYTGDVARRDEHGIVHFKGRNDDLIKSRGYRIELNEIEIALGGLSEQLLEFAALAVPDPLIENKLYAAVVLRKGVELSVDEIKKYCRTRIPGYMIPDDILVLDELPKTSSGKVSRKLLRQYIEGLEHT